MLVIAFDYRISCVQKAWEGG